jgi:3-oxoadipate enol-lactonase
MKQRIGDIEIHFQLHGEVDDKRRPWVVLSHSLACHGEMWAPQLSALAARYRVLNVDTRGHGGSDAPAGPYTLDLLADDLHGLLQARQIARPHLVGLSMGGMIAQTHALKHPGTFASLTLADTCSRWPESAWAVFHDRAQLALAQGMESLVEPTLQRWFTPGFRQANPSAVASIAATIRATSPVGFAGCSVAIPSINTTARLHEIACPIQIIVGKDDPGTPPAMSREMHENAPGSTLVVLENAAHLSNVEQAAAFNQMLLAFLARADALLY